MSEPTEVELAAARMAEALADFLDCADAGCVTPTSRHRQELEAALHAYIQAGGHATVGGDWEP